MLVIMQMKFKNAEHALQKLFSALPLGNKNINIKNFLETHSIPLRFFGWSTRELDYSFASLMSTCLDLTRRQIYGCGRRATKIRSNLQPHSRLLPPELCVRHQGILCRRCCACHKVAHF